MQVVLTFSLGGILTNRCSSVAERIILRARKRGATAPQRLLIRVAMHKSLTGFFIFALAFNLDVAVNFIWAIVRRGGMRGHTDESPR